MIKKAFLFFFLIAIFVCKAQKKISFGLVGEYSENFSISNYSGGIQVEVPAGDNFSLNYKGLIGGSTNQALYAHAPVGAAFGVILLRFIGTSNSSAANAFGAILMA